MLTATRRRPLINLSPLIEALTVAERDQAIARLERDTARAIARHFSRQGRRIVAALRPLRDRFNEGAARPIGDGRPLREQATVRDWEPVVSSVLVDDGEDLRGIIAGAHDQALPAGGDAALRQIGLTIAFQRQDPRAVAYAEGRAAAQVTRINDTTRDRLNRLLTEAVANNWGWDTTARRIIEQFDDFAGPPLFPSKKFTSRAQAIAAFEIGDAYEAGGKFGARVAQGLGYQVQKKWLNAGDHRVRDAHVANAGDDWIDEDDTFSGDGADRPPTDPGCRCTVIRQRVGPAPAASGRPQAPIETVRPGYFDALDRVAPDRRRAAMQRYINRQDIERSWGVIHGMIEGEHMEQIAIDGVRFAWKRGSRKSKGRVVDDLVDLHEVSVNRARAASLPDSAAAYPARLWRSTSLVVYTDQANKHDSFWAEVYGIEGFTSRATGGDGSIAVYGGGKLVEPWRGTGDTSTVAFDHEAGHNLAQNVYGRTNPPPGSRYAAAMETGEAPVSRYAENSPAEDFAEAVEFYMRGDLASVAPERYKVIDQIMRGGAG